MNNQTITLGDSKYTVVSDTNISNMTNNYIGLNEQNWNGPCIQCGGTAFSEYVQTRERKYQHFSSMGCGMRYDSRQAQPERARIACHAYLNSRERDHLP